MGMTRLAAFLVLCLFGASLAPGLPAAWAQHGHAAHDHGPANRNSSTPKKDGYNCNEPELRCATTATPVLDAKGGLWLVWATTDRVGVSRSLDRGKTFKPVAIVTPEPLPLDYGPDARPKMVIRPDGTIVVAFAIFKAKAYTGEVFVSRSTDSGKTFSKPTPITPSNASQRFETLTLDSYGRVFAAWLDKRNIPAAKSRGETYDGAALAFTWSDDGGKTFEHAKIAHDNTCECCRLGVAFTAHNQPVILFRNIFTGSQRDHAILAFDSADKPGPVRRVSVDQWETNACPHHGPSLAVSAQDELHVAWFTAGHIRSGLFYASSRDMGAHFTNPMAIGNADRTPSRPSLLSVAGRTWLAWLEYEGSITEVMMMSSPDGRSEWTKPLSLARTDGDADHPILFWDGQDVSLSWLSRNEGYRFLAVRKP